MNFTVVPPVNEPPVFWNPPPTANVPVGSVSVPVAIVTVPVVVAPVVVKLHVDVPLIYRWLNGDVPGLIVRSAPAPPANVVVPDRALKTLLFTQFPSTVSP